MRFSVEFESPTGEPRSVVVALSAEECRSIADLRQREGEEQADLIARSMAMRAAYGEIARGFVHVGPPLYLS
jgi:hypothetical protein